MTRQTNTPAQQKCSLIQLNPKELQKFRMRTFVDCLHPEANLAVTILAENNLPHPVGYLKTACSHLIHQLSQQIEIKCLIWSLSKSSSLLFFQEFDPHLCFGQASSQARYGCNKASSRHSGNAAALLGASVRQKIASQMFSTCTTAGRYSGMFARTSASVNSRPMYSARPG